MSESEVKEEEIAENEAAEVSRVDMPLDFYRDFSFICWCFVRSSTTMNWAIHSWARRPRAESVYSAKNCAA